MQISTRLPGNLRLTFETQDLEAVERMLEAMSTLPPPADVPELEEYIERVGAAARRAPLASVA